MKKMPDVVYLFPTYFDVKEMHEAEAETYVGRCDMSNHEIRLDLRQCEEEAKLTMMHEITHAILSVSGFKNQDEVMMDVLSSGFLNIIRGNKDLIRWLEEVK